MSEWTQEQAIALCKLIETAAPKHDCHVALTGGLLYKDGRRKDCDILFYRVRQAEKIDESGLLESLVKLGITIWSGGPGCWFIQGRYRGRRVDMFFPENEGGDYDHGGPSLEEPRS